MLASDPNYFGSPQILVPLALQFSENALLGNSVYLLGFHPSSVVRVIFPVMPLVLGACSLFESHCQPDGTPHALKVCICVHQIARPPNSFDIILESLQPHQSSADVVQSIRCHGRREECLGCCLVEDRVQENTVTLPAAQKSLSALLSSSDTKHWSACN